MTTGLSFDERYLLHDTGAGHPECPERLTSTLEYLRARPWFAQLAPVDAVHATRESVGAIHSSEYIERAADACRAGMPVLDSLDVTISPDSFDTALLAAGAPMALADAIVNGGIDNGFALVRPPGHHAEHGMALGFCLFNNVAILARHVQQRHGIDKVLILDWDVHHGNGTQHSFEEDPSVLYVSTHQYPYYPGTGAWYEDGNGRGKGATLNCPMAANSTDGDYESAFVQQILPKIDGFKPEFIIISAGFDAHRDDPLAQMRLSTGFFGWMTARMMEAADRHASGRVVSVLEGGYNLQQLPACVGEHLSVLSGNSGAV